MSEMREPLVHVEDLSKQFPIPQGILDAIRRKPKQALTAVDHVSFDIYQGDTLGLVGESGCRKSTLAKTLIRLYAPTGGRIVFAGTDLSQLDKTQLKEHCKNIQMIFQDPYSSLNPRMTVRQILAEELTYHNMCSKEEMDKTILELLALVGLTEQQADRYPGEFSGGQRQRIGIARALALRPKLIIADEPVSALDVSIQAQVINLLIDLQKKLGLTILFISHDLRVVRYITNRVAVMYLGKIVEMAETDELYDHSEHPYTDILLKAAPKMTAQARQEQSEVIHGDLPSPIHLPSGCRFHPRCPYATEACKKTEPQLVEIRPGHLVACHHPLEGVAHDNP